MREANKDKERLEEIKQTINHPNYTEHNGQEEIYFMVSDNDFNWLIEQSERVQELENKCEYLSDTNEMLLDLNGVLPDQPELYIKLKKEIKRLEDFIETIQNVYFVKLQREKAENRRYREVIRECIERMNEGGAGTRSFVYEKLIEVLERNNDA